MSLDLRLVNYPCWGELEKDENVTVIEKEESETTSIIYKGEESVFYPITDSGWDCPDPIKATAVNAEFLEYLWQTYGTMWYTDKNSPEYAYDYMMLLKNIRERYDVWEHILLDYWKTAYIGSLVQPLFNRGANIANLKIAKAEQEVAVLNFQQSLLNAGAEVNDALTALQTARRKLDIDNTQVATLQEAVRKTELLMRHSSANYLEVLTAQQTLLTAKQAVAQDRFDEIQSIITLYHSLGGGK